MINLRGNFKVYLWTVIGTFIFFIFFSWLRDTLSGEQGRIRKFVMQAKKTVESKNILACADIVSLSYHDKYGLDRQGFLYGAKEFFNYYKAIFISIEKMDISLDESKNNATVQITALVIAENQHSGKEKILEGEKGKFAIKLIKEDKKWRLLEMDFFEPISIMGQNAV